MISVRESDVMNIDPPGLRTGAGAEAGLNIG